MAKQHSVPARINQLLPRLLFSQNCRGLKVDSRIDEITDALMVVGMCCTIIGHAGLRSDGGGSCPRVSATGQVGSSPQQEASQQQVGVERGRRGRG